MHPHVRRVQGIIAAEIGAHRSPEDACHRLRVISDTPNPTRKAAKFALHNSMGVLHPLLEPLYIRQYANLGLEVVGIGHHSTVIRTGGEVIKIVRQSRDLDPLSCEALAQKLERGVRVITTRLPAVAIPTLISTEADPIGSGTVVTLRQPYVERDPEPPADASAQLSKFAQTSLSELLPEIAADIAGSGNLVFSNAKLCLLDTVPEFYPQEGYQEKILKRLVDGYANQ